MYAQGLACIEDKEDIGSYFDELHDHLDIEGNV
jgi:hypothetical protein